MSSFICEQCGAVIEDTPFCYVTGCEHWPKEPEDEHDYSYCEDDDLLERLEHTIKEKQP